MGQYLAIGIVTKCTTSKAELLEEEITIDELIVEMQKELHFEPSIYDFSESNDSYLFNLKADVLANQLIPFLEKIYPLIYPEIEGEIYYKSVIETLKSNDASTWISLSEDNDEEAFQFDKYGEADYVSFRKPFNPNVTVYYSSIMLSAEGDIGMEEYGRQFNFFKFCIQNSFPEFSIAKAIRVYITG